MPHTAPAGVAVPDAAPAGVPVPARLDDATAASIAVMLQALATPSRLRILTTLRHGPYDVGSLADAVGMEHSAVSHQLRLLRALGLVTGHREGRRIVYRLYDDHVAQLLDQAVHHIEHLLIESRPAHHHSTATTAARTTEAPTAASRTPSRTPTTHSPRESGRER
ncbi:ArsR/SmtB family transcription factor [Streptomyces sp. Da 82-17]|uniref:ArsR/SmtB family transcription factor n=1 Tax=Streptomyces sp. Da 82-17 TaxID=3377116 RepID=UPI0038D4C6DE